MTALTPRLRRFTLAAHVTFSVGWLGAVASFLALAVAGLTSPDAQMVRSAYIALGVTGWFVIVPLSLVSILTGLILSLGTSWGVFRHYWVLVKALMTLPATLVLLVHMQPIGYLAAVAANSPSAIDDLSELRTQLVVQAGAAVIVLLVATALSVYKPRGMTQYGWRAQNQQRPVAAACEAVDRAPRSD